MDSGRKIKITVSKWLNLFHTYWKAWNNSDPCWIVSTIGWGLAVSLRMPLRFKEPGASEIQFQGKIYCFTNINTILGLNRKMTSDMPRIYLSTGRSFSLTQSVSFLDGEVWTWTRAYIFGTSRTLHLSEYYFTWIKPFSTLSMYLSWILTLSLGSKWHFNDVFD